MGDIQDLGLYLTPCTLALMIALVGFQGRALLRTTRAMDKLLEILIRREARKERM